MTSVPPLAPSGSRRLIAGLVRLGLAVIAVVIVITYVKHHWFHSTHTTHVQTTVPATEALGPGDVRIYNADSSVDVVLQGDRLMTGLSPKTVAKVRAEMDKPDAHDSAGSLGANISQLVKKTVAGAIGTHVVYRVADIRDIRFDDGQLRVEWVDGRHDELFGSARVDGERTSNTFRQDEAQRLIDAFHARKSGR
jgi:hypothetical protein